MLSVVSPALLVPTVHSECSMSWLQAPPQLTWTSVVLSPQSPLKAALTKGTEFCCQKFHLVHLFIESLSYLSRDLLESAYKGKSMQ